MIFSLYLLLHLHIHFRIRSHIQLLHHILPLHPLFIPLPRLFLRPCLQSRIWYFHFCWPEKNWKWHRLKLFFGWLGQIVFRLFHRKIWFFLNLKNRLDFYKNMIKIGIITLFRIGLGWICLIWILRLLFRSFWWVGIGVHFSFRRLLHFGSSFLVPCGSSGIIHYLVRRACGWS